MCEIKCLTGEMDIYGGVRDNRIAVLKTQQVHTKKDHRLNFFGLVFKIEQITSQRGRQNVMLYSVLYAC